jgi:hypothetical protein
MMSWRERRRRERDWRSERREFIYLDEVSVISLVAARDGGIADTITEKLTRSAEAESKTSLSVPLKGGAKVGAQSRHKVTDSSSREVVRRSVIQSTFGDLRFGGKNTSPPLVQEYRELPRKLVACIAKPEDLSAHRNRKLKKLKKLGLLTALGTLRRGDVIEIDIRLRPNKAFSLAAAIESFVDIMQGRSEVFGDASAQVADVIPIGEVLDRLMVGLIPIHGAPTNIVLVDIDGKPHLIDNRVIKAESPFANAARSWEVVGVTEEPSYWKDLRRVLYTRERFTVYARVVNPDLMTHWNPVKLSGLMGDVSQDVAREIVALPDQLERQLNQSEPEPTVDLRGMFQRFAELIEADFENTPDPTTIGDAVSEAVAIFINADGDMSQERAASDAVVAVFEKANEHRSDREDVAEKRTLARAATYAASALTPTPIEPAPKLIDQLEVEVIAIYW